MPHSRMALLLVLGCTNADAPPLHVTVDTLPGNIPRTTTHVPVEGGEWAIVHERDIQPVSGAAGELVNPHDLALADDGTLFVVESDPIRVNVYGPEGRFLRSIGGPGAGPGEFRVGFIAVRGDTLVLQDPLQSRATVFRASNGDVLSIRPTTCCVWSPINIDARGGAWLPTMTPPGASGVPARAFLRLALAGGGADTVVVPQAAAVADAPRWNVVDHNGQMQMSMTVPMHPRAHEEVDPSGSLVTGHGGAYELRRTSDGRDTVALFGRPFRPTPISSAERQALVDARVARQLENDPDGVDESLLRRAFDPSLIPDHRPAFERIYVDRGGRTFVMRAVADTLAVHLDLFGRDGIWLDSLVVPESTWARQSFSSVAFSRDHLAVLTEDEAGLPLVRIYRIERAVD